MTAKKCQKCGKTNPPFFTHCISCGVKLEDEEKKTISVYSYIKTGLFIGITIYLVILVILLTGRFSMTYGQNFSEAVLANPAADLQNTSEYGLNQPVGNNDLQVMVSSARDGQTAANSSKFFLVSVTLKNIRTDRNIRISNSDFELIDSEGTKYQPYGIGSQLMVDLGPSHGDTTELTFVIPQNVQGKKIRFMVPATSGFSGSRTIMVFVI
jgi:hypothetical protein